MCSCVTFRAFLRISCDVLLFTLCLSPLWYLFLSALCICVFCILLYDVCIVHFCVLCLHAFCTASMYFLCSICTVSVHFLYRVCMFSLPCPCNFCAVSVHSLCWLSYWLSGMLFYLSAVCLMSRADHTWIELMIVILIDLTCLCWIALIVPMWLVDWFNLFWLDLIWFDWLSCLLILCAASVLFRFGSVIEIISGDVVRLSGVQF
jgi:hypothetical protein